MSLAQFVISGLALGAIYGLVALGFVVIYKSTGVVSLAQGGLVLLGAYLVFSVHVDWGLNFFIALFVSAIATGIVAALIGGVIFRRMTTRPVFSIIMVTIGFLYLLQQGASAIWGDGVQFLKDPWGSRQIRPGGVPISLADIWTVAIAGCLLLALLIFFRYSAYGLAVRASARDPEAAAACGIGYNGVVLFSWAIAGVVAALAGTMLSTGSRGLSPDLSSIAFRALPAMVLGGLDSLPGAVVGGAFLGVAEVVSSGYSTQLSPYLGQNFYSVLPYVVMILIMVIRPRGFFGSKRVERV
jgi:branched-chain amino acid transport system permease protein